MTAQRTTFALNGQQLRKHHCRAATASKERQAVTLPAARARLPLAGDRGAAR